MVIPLCDCIARPTKPREDPFRLLAHLEAVAKECGDKNGTLEDKLAFLAGLAHDAAKAACRPMVASVASAASLPAATLLFP